jgi:hypothetical protein
MMLVSCEDTRDDDDAGVEAVAAGLYSVATFTDLAQRPFNHRS